MYLDERVWPDKRRFDFSEDWRKQDAKQHWEGPSWPAFKTGIEQGRIAVLGSFGVQKQAIASHLLPPFVTMVVEKEEKELMGFMESTEVLEDLETWDKGLTKPSRALAEANTKF